MATSRTLINNRYQLHESLGKGGMGTVFRATDRLRGQTVALKRVLVKPQNLQFNSRSSESRLNLALAREFQTLAALRHPHLISVLDYGFDANGQPFFTMSLLENAFPITRAAAPKKLAGKIELVLQVLGALAYLHRRGILHRDLKPANVMVEGGEQVRVLDFGLAVESDKAKGTAGTLAYMAPEILRGGPASVQSDLYAVGVILYQLLAGQLPFNAPDRRQFYHEILHRDPDLSALRSLRSQPARPARPPRPYSTLVEDNDETRNLDESATRERPTPRTPIRPRKPAPNLHPIAQVIDRLLAKKPEQRYPDAAALIEALCAAAEVPPPVETATIRENYLPAATFVGREAELAQLENALGEAADNRGSGWLVAGKSGAGKSRLLDEVRLRALVRGVLVLEGQAHSGSTRPYQMWQEPLRRLCLAAELTPAEASTLKSLLPDIESLLGREVAAPAGPSDHHLLVATVISLLRRAGRPVLLRLEDLHRAADGLGLLAEVSAVVDELPVLVIGSVCSEEAPNLLAELPAMQTLPLPRLAEDAIAQLSQAMLGEAGRDAGLVARLQRETEGNVFFLVEMVRALGESAGRLDAIEAEALPDSILTGGLATLLERRLARLPAWGHDLLALAAVAGREIDVAILQQASRDGAPPPDVEAWLLAGAESMVFEIREQGWRFAHDKLREQALAALSDEQTATLHRQIAQAIQTVYPDHSALAARLAAHWRRAGDVQQEAEYSLLAAGEAIRGSSFPPAQAMAERALELIAAGANIDHAQAHHRLAQARYGQGDYPAAQAAFEQSLALAQHEGEASAVASIIRGLANSLIKQGHADRAMAYLQESLTLCQQVGDVAGEAQTRLITGTARREMGNTTEAQEDLAEALALLRQTDNPPATCHCLNELGITHDLLGEFDKSVPYYEEGLAIARRIGDRLLEARLVGNLGIAHHFQGQPAAAETCYLAALEIGQQTGNRQTELINAGNLAAIYFTRGRLEETRDILSRVVDAARRSGATALQASYTGNLGFVCHALGQVADSEGYFRQALDLMAGSSQNDPMTYHGYADLLVDSGRLEEGLAMAGRGLELAQAAGETRHIAMTQLGLGRARLAAGQVAAARPLLEAAAGNDSTQDAALAWALLGTACLLLDDEPPAQHAFQSAAQVADAEVEENPHSINNWYVLGLARAGLALLGEGKLAGAAAAYRQARRAAPFEGVRRAALHDLEILARAGRGDLGPARAVLL